MQARVAFFAWETTLVAKARNKAIDKQGLCRLGSCERKLFPTRDVWQETLIP
jgi:hypothetical protein